MKVTQKVWIRAEEKYEMKWNEETNKHDHVPYIWFSTHELDMTDSGWTMVSREPIEITFDIPDTFNFNENAIEALRQEEKNLIAEFEARRTQLQARLNRYLAIAAPKTDNGMDILGAVDDYIPF